MKFKVLVAGLLAAILAVNTFMAYTVIQKEKKQTKMIDLLIRTKIEETYETNLHLHGELIEEYHKLFN